MSELQFVTNLHDLISLQNEKYGEDYVKDLKDVERLGISLPKLQIPKDFLFNNTSTGDNETETLDSAINITLKSIKPPHKFQLVLKSSLSNTVYKLKEDLIKSNSDFSKFEPKNFKFLIKGKVLNDSVFLREVTSEDVTVTVFVTEPSPSVVTAAPLSKLSDANQDDEPEIEIPEAKLEITSEIWTKFRDVLLSHYNDADSEKILKKLKKGWDL